MSPLQGPGELNFLNRLREFLVVFLPFAVLFAIAVSAHYYSVYSTEKLSIETREMLNVGLARSELNNDLATVISDLKFLSSHLEKKAFYGFGQIKHSNVTDLLTSFSNEKRLYDQIRFIDFEGQEIIRINFRAGKAYAVPGESLQNKAERYYFKESIKLAPGEVYISPLDLNVEQNIVESPTKPVIRFAIPIYSGKSEKRGVLVLNYLAERILQSFIRASANIADHVHLLNKDGYWLHAPDDKDAWGFILSHERRFSNDYTQAWSEMRLRRTGQVRTDNGLFTFETVTPISVAAQSLLASGLTEISIPQEAERWFVVSRLESADDAPSLWAFFLRNMPLYSLMFLVLLLGSWLLAMTRLKHRRAEMESEYERRFRHVLESMELAAVNVDLDANVRFCNDSFLHMTGWQREEILNDDWIGRFVAPERRDYVQSVFSKLKQGEEFPTEVEAEVITREGTRRLISWHNTLSFGTDSKVSGITAIGEDITEKRQAEAQVRKLSRAVEHSPSIVMLTDKRGQIEYVNPMFTKVTGYTLDEVRGLNPRILKSGETTDEDYKSLWGTLISGGVWRGEFHNRRKNGELYWESASISALQDENGKITNFIAVKEDITNRKRLEDEIEHQQLELARHQALTAMGRMAGEIAHDLRNPLSSVKMSLQILGRQAMGEQQELKQIGLGQISYMENILADMLTFARPENIKSEWVDVVSLLYKILKNHQDCLDKSNVKLIFNQGDDIPLIAGDSDKLQRMINNLISNAIQALDHEKIGDRQLSVEVNFFKKDKAGNVEVQICDNGVGLGDLETESLFEPFFTTHAQGTGLGLAIVRQIAEQHHGSVDLSQVRSDLTCAKVILPSSALLASSKT